MSDNAMGDHETQVPADDSTVPRLPSAAVPVGLILAGLILGLLIACNGFINALTPEPESIDVHERADPSPSMRRKAWR